MNRIWVWLLSFLLATCCNVVAQQPPKAKPFPPLPPAPISLVILHAKQYTFSTHLFDGTADNGRMALTARIKNVSSSPVTVTTASEGVISVASIIYESEKIRPHTLQPSVVPVSFDDDPIAVASENLVTLAPQTGQDVPITLINRFVYSEGQDPTEFQYTPPGRGFYTMTFEYSYSGFDNNFPNVYHGTVRSAPVVVEVK